jgi:hypothetical protein
MMTGYLDDSYNNETVVVGGWIAEDEIWKNILVKWDARIDYENRISLIHGLPLIKRYKASDCANRVKDFKDWDVGRQIRFAKRLVGT